MTEEVSPIRSGQTGAPSRTRVQGHEGLSYSLPPNQLAKGKTLPRLGRVHWQQVPRLRINRRSKGSQFGLWLERGKGFIWVSMPYVQKGKKENAVTWWGDRQATIDYCKVNLPRICKEFGGDPGQPVYLRVFPRCHRMQLHRIGGQ